MSGTTARGFDAGADRPAALPSSWDHTIRAARQGRADEIACRALDIALSAALLILLMPVMLVIAAAVRLDSPGGALFRQRRVGHKLTPFVIHKFRTMRAGVDHDVHRRYVLTLIAGEETPQSGGGPRYKLHGDQRVTRLGRMLRKSSLDELPQLWDVLCGHMSLVGPRPPIPYEVEHYPPHWFERFEVKPGITGLWQIGGRSDLTLEEMISLDAEYVHRRSFWLNLRILARTPRVVIGRRGAS